MSDQRNLLFAVVLSMVVVFGWQYLVGVPKIQEEQAKQAQSLQQQKSAPAAQPGTNPGAASVGQAVAGVPREAVLAKSAARASIDTPKLAGSINLTGGRFDDLRLRTYHETPDPRSPEIDLLSPMGSEHPYFAEFGWIAAEGSMQTAPGANTDWKLMQGDKLSPGHDLELAYDNGQGLVFTRRVSVNANSMFTITDTVDNHGTNAVTLYPYGLVSRHNIPVTTHYWVVHEGFIGVLGGTLKDPTYDDLGKNNGTQVVIHHLFAGAKVVDLVNEYGSSLGIQRFDMAVDWGWFAIITKPIFQAIDFLYRYVGNFGIAILIFTVFVKALFFPLANTSYRAMSKMKKLQPEMERLRERFKDDKVQQQQAMMQLYSKEKVNPISGCLPMLIQIPVFFSLYKVLLVTIDMRHAPFFGWIKDLSAPDPTSVFNLFGLIPYTPPQFLMLGVFPILMGATMWLQTNLNPPPADPVQQKIFGFMPLIFTFMLANFPV